MVPSIASTELVLANALHLHAGLAMERVQAQESGARGLILCTDVLVQLLCKAVLFRSNQQEIDVQLDVKQCPIAMWPAV